MTYARRGASSLRRAITAGDGLCRQTLFFSIVLAAAVSAIACAEAPDTTSERAARDEAVRAIPWRQLPAQHRRAAQFVIGNASIYRRLPTRIIDCDPDMFTFLLQHPEVVIDVWRVMGLSQVELDKRPDGDFRGSDGAGTTGTVRYLYADYGRNADNLAVIFANGAYEGKPFLAPLKAQSLVLLRSGAIQETNGRHYITVRVDSFVKIEHLGIELIAKTVRPWISKTADQNFLETLSFVSNFSRTAEQNPHGMQRLATRLPTLDETTRNELVDLAFRTAERYAKLEAATRADTRLVARRTSVPVADAQWIGPLPAAPVTR
jgi:hypothetical protein